MSIQRALSTLLVVLGTVACTQQRSPSSLGLELSLYSGIRQIVNIGDPEDKVLRAAPQWTPERVDLSADPGVDRVKFSHMLFFKEIGTRAYFRNGRVALIEVQDPFEGVVQGKKLRVFRMSPTTPSWEANLITELGMPSARAGGGTFGSEALYYEWGDVSFNGSGPNEIAIYRDPVIAKYRQNHFGRKIKLF